MTLLCDAFILNETQQTHDAIRLLVFNDHCRSMCEFSQTGLSEDCCPSSTNRNRRA